MRRKQAALSAFALIIGGLSTAYPHERSPDHALVVSASADLHRGGVVGLDLPRKTPLQSAVSRGHVRTALELHRVPAEKVRTARGPSSASAQHIRPHFARLSGAEQWAASAYVTRIRRCESGDDPTVVSVHNGVTYYGLYQMNADFWTTYGGDPAYLRSPFRAPRWLQNEVAYRGYLHRGYEPWSCA